MLQSTSPCSGSGSFVGHPRRSIDLHVLRMPHYPRQLYRTTNTKTKKYSHHEKQCISLNSPHHCFHHQQTITTLLPNIDKPTLKSVAIRTYPGFRQIKQPDPISKQIKFVRDYVCSFVSSGIRGARYTGYTDVYTALL